jgi:hypothetical protein
VPVVFDRSNPGGGPGDKKPGKPAAKPAPKPAAKAGAGGAKGKSGAKGKADAGDDKTKIIALSVVIGLALCFVAWYLFMANRGGGESSTGSPSAMYIPQPQPGAGQQALPVQPGVNPVVPRRGGISLDDSGGESAAPRGPAATEGIN